MLITLAAALADRPAHAEPLSGVDSGRACAADGRTCIEDATYVRDVCRVIEEAAAAERLDLNFLARLLWRESLFDAGAVSPAGAQGIAQFMPGTAQLRGFEDPFNPAETILASAAYLRDLELRFGSLGLAAVAYNAGEARAARYQAGQPFLPAETRAYVLAITGHPAKAWLDQPLPEPVLALDPELPFREACHARAEDGDLNGPEPARPSLQPWGVILAGQGSREAAERQALSLVDRHQDALSGEEIVHTRAQVPGMSQLRHVAQVGRASRAEADALCADLRAEGGRCMVLRN